MAKNSDDAGQQHNGFLELPLNVRNDVVGNVMLNAGLGSAAN